MERSHPQSYGKHGRTRPLVRRLQLVSDDDGELILPPPPPPPFPEFFLQSHVVSDSSSHLRDFNGELLPPPPPPPPFPEFFLQSHVVPNSSSPLRDSDGELLPPTPPPPRIREFFLQSHDVSDSSSPLRGCDGELLLPPPPPPPFPESLLDSDDDDDDFRPPPPPPFSESQIESDDEDHGEQVLPPTPHPSFPESHTASDDEDYGELLPPPPPPFIIDFFPDWLSQPDHRQHHAPSRTFASSPPPIGNQSPQENLQADAGSLGDPRLISTFPVTNGFLADESHRLCVVCTDEFAVGSEVKRLPCSHVYHGDCIMTWLSQQNSCPVCRFQVTPPPKPAGVFNLFSQLSSNTSQI